MIKKFQKNEKGFTLVELVVVIAILALLAALLVPRIMGNVEDARASREVANARTIASEISTYNALESTSSSGLAIAPGRYYDGGPNSSNLAVINRENDLPNTTYADIVVDSEGNASVTIKSY